MLIKLRIIGLNNELLTYSFFYYQMVYLFKNEIGASTYDTMSMEFFFDNTTNIGKLLHNYPEYFPVPAGVSTVQSDFSDVTEFFTLTQLQMNGGLDYNYTQAGFSLVGRVQGGDIRLVGM